MLWRMRRFFVLAVLVFLADVMLWGAGLGGLVVDMTGAPIAGAHIEVLTPLQAVALSLTSGADGRFVVPPLGRGDYQLRVTADGFAERRIGVRVTDDDDMVTVQLDVAAVHEDVTVSASPEPPSPSFTVSPLAARTTSTASPLMIVSRSPAASASSAST